MKFLVDAQLPKTLSDFLKKKGHDSVHTLELPGKNKTPDSEIIRIAIREGRVLISKDNDFLNSYIINKEPTKLVFVSTGNITNDALLKLFDLNIDKLTDFLIDYNLVEVDNWQITIHH